MLILNKKVSKIMKMQFIGTGSAFTMNNYQTNVIVEENGHRLLIETGE